MKRKLFDRDLSRGRAWLLLRSARADRDKVD